MPRRMGTATPEERAGFDLLLETVLNTPEQVPKLVEERPQLLDCVNNAAETVLHWLAIENRVEEIRLVHRLGATIPDFALVHALEAGHLDTVDLLLSLGGRFGSVDPMAVMENPIWKLTAERKTELSGCLRTYGYD